MEILADSTVLHKPELHAFERDGLHFFLDGDSPHWAATDSRGARLMELWDGRRGLAEVLGLYAAREGFGLAKAWRDVRSFSGEALRAGLLSTEPFKRTAYRGRAAVLEPAALREFWVHLLQACNLSCSHCLVSSGPQGDRGPDGAFIRSLMDQAHELGARRFYFTGGEPFARPDILELIRHATGTLGAELVVLTNATLLEAARLEGLSALDRGRLKFQVSLDGVRPEVNDSIRGRGVFEKVRRGLKALGGLGFESSLTAVVTRENLGDLEGLPRLARDMGAKSAHLLWLHRRGRVLEGGAAPSFPANAELLALARRLRSSAAEQGVLFDNWESLKLRANGQPGMKYDLGNPCWESLCLYSDGWVYPSAAMAGVPALRLGKAGPGALRPLWLESPVSRALRQASVAGKDGLKDHPFRFLTGGGDMEHSYFFSGKAGPEAVLSEDPYHELYVELLKDAMVDLAEAGRAALNLRSGFDAPVLYHAMGRGSVHCSEDAQAWVEARGSREVLLLHSNCVLSFDVERPYRAVQRFYGQAALEPKQDLCCPVKYPEEETRHIPQDVLDRFYGCGSPVALAAVGPGETVADLGSGAGIDCFIAAKKVGRGGRVIGVDMTGEMLGVARSCAARVAERLGFDVVEFRRGYLEELPLEEASADLVTSNCVINLSPDKGKVFSEIWRVLKDQGRLVVADIVSRKPVPLSLQAHQELWGECLSGALTEEELLAGLERAGFHGISLLKKSFWKEVEGQGFYSVTVRAYKSGARQGAGARAVYQGPYKAVMDEGGRLFPRGEAVGVDARTAAKLRAAPYAGQFLVSGAEDPAPRAEACCAPSAEKCC